jgi:hypothetical protein
MVFFFSIYNVEFSDVLDIYIYITQSFFFVSNKLSKKKLYPHPDLSKKHQGWLESNKIFFTKGKERNKLQEER